MPPRKQAPAPVAPPKPDNPDIPLHCLLCPKKPKFSDVSHLLTHVSSKSHLSHRFKAEIRSHKDPELREALQQFETWWRRYNIRELLCDRMDAKDNKAAPKRGRAQSPDVKPRKLLKSGREALSRQSTNGSLHAHSTRQDYDDDDSPYRTPVTRRSQRLAANGGSKRQMKIDPYLDEDDEAEEPDDNLKDEEHVDVTTAHGVTGWASDKSKLKGVFWPGMSLFDSATDEQKRKRNQRKDAGVLKNMEQVAAGVEPTECIWSEEFTDLQRTRDIYATPSVFGSPEPEEVVVEPKKRRARRSTTSTKAGPTRKKRTSTSAAALSRKAIKQEDDDDIILASEVRDESLETTPDDDLDSEDNKLVSSSSTNSPHDVYDVFRDPPAAASGQFDLTLQQYQIYNSYDPQYFYNYSDPESSSPALTWTSGLTDGSINTMNFESANRSALQPLSSNIAMHSPRPNTINKQLTHLRRGHSDMTMSPSSFFPHPYHNGQGNFNNPLALTHGRSQLSYTNQFNGNGLFGQEDPKPSTGFQPINMMPGIQINPYSQPNGANYFAAPAPQEEARDFEL